MAFIPSSTLGSVNANLGEFILGVIEQADPTFRCSISASASFAGSLQARGAFTVAGVSSAQWVEGYKAFRLPIQKPTEWAKPPLSAGIDQSSPLAYRLLFFARITEESHELVDSVTGITATLVGGSVGTSVTRSPDLSGQGVKFAINTGHYDFGTAARQSIAAGGIFTAAVAVNLAGASNSRIFGRYNDVSGNIPAITGQWCMSARDGSTQVNVSIVTNAGLFSVDVTVPSGFGVVAMSYDGTTLRAYVNGFPAGTATASSPLLAALDGFGNPSSLEVCGNNFADQSFNGTLYGAWLWDRVLSDIELSMLWQRPYANLTLPVRRYAVINPATINHTGTFTAAGRGTASWAGALAARGAFTVQGKATSSWTSFTQRLGSFTCSPRVSASWIPKTSFGSIAFTVAAVGSASWISKASLAGSFAVHGVGAVRWQAAGVMLGSFLVNGVGTAQFLVGLDGVPYTCLTKGDKPTVVVHFPNFVY